MALTALPTITSVDKTDDGSNTVIADSTVYGGLNPLRTAVAVALLAFKVDEDLVETALTIQSYDPESVTSFTVTNTIDGHQKFVLLIFNEYDSGTVYNEFDAVFYPLTGLYYRSISTSPFSGVDPTNTTNWEVVTPTQIYDAIDTGNESANVITGTLQTVLTFSATQCLGDIAPLNAKANCGSGNCKDDKLEQKMNELWLLVFTATLASTRQQYLEGERMMRLAENYCDCDC